MTATKVNHQMTTPSGTPSDAELVAFLQDFAGWELAGGDAARDSGNAAADKVCRENADRINEAAARITALSAQVAELSDELERTRRNNQTEASLIESLGERAEKAEARIAELERDKAMLDWLEEWALSLSRLTSPDMSGIRFVGQAFNPAKARGEAGPSYIRIQGQTIRKTVEAAMNHQGPK